MALPVLDLYILSQLALGLKTPYDLQAQTGMSLGASVPALRRLKKNGFIQRERDSGTGRRRRHCYALTESGRREAKRGWKSYVSAPHPPNDVDAILRLVDIAMHYRATQADVTHFLERAAEDKAALARQMEAKLFRLEENPLSYESARTRCEYARLGAEAATLKTLAAMSVSRGKRQGAAARRGAKCGRIPDEMLSFHAEGDAKVDQKG